MIVLCIHGVLRSFIDRFMYFLFIYKNVQRKKYGKICCDNITRNINESHDTYMYLYIVCI